MASLGVVCYVDTAGAKWHPEMPGSRDIISAKCHDWILSSVFNKFDIAIELIDLLVRCSLFGKGWSF